MIQKIKPALILAALLASGCRLHTEIEILAPLNKGGNNDSKHATKPKPIVRPTPRPAPEPTPFPRPWGGQ